MQTGLVFCPGPKKMTNVANNKHNALFDQTQRKTRIKFPQGVNKKAMQKNPAISRREQPRLHTPKSVNPMKNLNTYISF